MGYHYFRIETENAGFRFKLYPCNSHTQPMGTSNLFPTKAEAEKGLEHFRFLVRSSADIFALFSWKQNGKHFKYKLLENSYGIDFNNERGYEQESRLKKSLISIKDHIDAKLIND